MKFTTSNLYLAAYLLLEGVTIEKIAGHGRKVFIFDQDEEEVSLLEKKFFDKQARVEPQAYADELRSLKARLN